MTQWLRLALAAVVAGQSMAFGIGANLTPPTGVSYILLHALLAGSAIAVFLLVGLPIAHEAFAAARGGRIVIEQLFLLGIGGAFAASLQSSITHQGAIYYEVVSVLVAIYTFGRLVGERHRAAALEAAESLRAQFAQCWRIAPDGSIERVATAEIRPGDRVRVRPREGVPVDGAVRSGTSFVRETALTGEMFPVVKRAGDEILAGSVAEDGTLVVEAGRPGAERRLDALLRAVAEARERKPALQREADRIVSWFLPAVVCAALATFVGWTLARGLPAGIFNAMAVLLVACPCAMGLATPIAIWNALNGLARLGVALRSGDAIERIARCDTAVFDKTGTLSEEQLVVADLVALAPHPRESLRSWIGAIQAGNTHPVALAFASWAPPGTSRLDGDLLPVPGIGIEGDVIGGPDPAGARRYRIRIGNEGCIRDDDARARAAELRALLPHGLPHSHEFFVAVDGEVVALAALRERLRDSSPDALRQLGTLGLELWIMTGDPNWKAVAGDSPVPPARILAGLSPDEKASRIGDLAGRGRLVLFVGDGVNDAAAMTRAHAGLAMGAGADLTRESAGGELFTRDLARVADTVRTCRSTVAAVRGNLLFAACYNAIGVGLAAAGLLHPITAALLMLVSSMTVTWRALRGGQQQTPPAEPCFGDPAGSDAGDRIPPGGTAAPQH